MISQQEDEAWQLIRQGDRDAYAMVYRKYFTGLYQYASRIVADDALIKDAIQDLFIRIWTHREQLSRVRSVKGYLFCAIRHVLFNKLKENNRTAFGDPEIFLRDFEVTCAAENDLIRDEADTLRARVIWDALGRLNARQKEVLYLRYYEDIGFEEVASIMCISVKALYKLTARSLRSLKKALPKTWSASAVY